MGSSIKIHRVEGFGIFAVTDMQTKEIAINKNLDKYPELKQIIIRHEKQHIKDDSYFKAFLLDMKDYRTLYARLDFWEFHHKYVKKKWHEKLRHILYTIMLNIFAGTMGSYYTTKLALQQLWVKKV